MRNILSDSPQEDESFRNWLLRVVARWLFPVLKQQLLAWWAHRQQMRVKKRRRKMKLRTPGTRQARKRCQESANIGHKQKPPTQTKRKLKRSRDGSDSL